MTKKTWVEYQRGVKLTNLQKEKSADGSHVWLNKQESYEINEKKDKRKLLLIKRSSKSKYRYQLVVRQKTIKYKENFLYHLSSIASLAFICLFISKVSRRSPSWMLINLLYHLSPLLVIWRTYNQAHCYDGYLIRSSARILFAVLPLDCLIVNPHLTFSH